MSRTFEPRKIPICDRLPATVRSGGLVLVVLGCLAMGLSTQAPAWSADDDETRVEKFLTRLGLVDLRTLHLEQVLKGQLPDAERTEIAKRLADVYASQLVAYAADKEKYDDVVDRINRLVAAVPTAETPALKVMLLQADYFRAEKLINNWIVDRSLSTDRDDALAILTRITPQLMASYRQLRAASDKLQEEIDELEEGDEQAAKMQQAMQLQSVAGRAGYFAGWSGYYLGLARQSINAQTNEFVSARDMFRLLLGLEGEYKDVDEEFLGLESIRRAQALIGLALAEAGAGNLDASAICFDWLDSGGAPPGVRDEGPYWRLQSLLNADRIDLALAYAKQQIAALNDSATNGKISFCVSLVRAAFAGAQTPSPDLQELGMLGIAGLAKLRQRGPVRALLKKYDIDLNNSNGFYLNWIKGQQLTEEAEAAKSQELFEEAAAVLERASQAEDARQDLASLGQCQTHLATCYYRLGRLEDSARMFEKAAAARKATGDDKAVDAAWSAFVAYQKLAKDEPRFVPAAIAVLQQIKRDYPQHEYAQQADYYISKLQQSSASPAESLASLEKLSPGSPNYLPARYDICVIRHGQWKKATGRERQQTGDQLIADANTFLQAAGADGNPSQQVKVSSLAASVALDRDPPDLALAASYLDRAAGWADTLATSSNVAAEYHYYAMKLAAARDQQDAQAAHAAWLAQHGQGSPFELSGLVAAARAADAAVQRAGSGPSDAAREAHRVYARLSQLFGESPSALAEKKNARVAMSKAAQYAAQLGDHREAAQRLDQLLAVDSQAKDRSYLRRSGLAHYQAGQYDSSLQRWRTLLAGLRKGTSEWYEAKYYQMACLAASDPDKLAAVLKQFELLYPNVPSPWKEKIATLPR